MIFHQDFYALPRNRVILTGEPPVYRILLGIYLHILITWFSKNIVNAISDFLPMKNLIVEMKDNKNHDLVNIFYKIFLSLYIFGKFLIISNLCFQN